MFNFPVKILLMELNVHAAQVKEHINAAIDRGTAYLAAEVERVEEIDWREEEIEGGSMEMEMNECWLNK